MGDKLVDKVQRLPKDGGTRHHPQLLEIETQQLFMMLGTGGGKAAEKVPRFQAGDTVRQRMDTVEDTVAHRFLVGDKWETHWKAQWETECETRSKVPDGRLCDTQWERTR